MNRLGRNGRAAVVLLLVVVVSGLSWGGLSVWLSTPAHAHQMLASAFTQTVTPVVGNAATSPYPALPTSSPSATLTLTKTASPTPSPTRTPTLTKAAIPTASPTPTLYLPDPRPAPAILDSTWETLPVIPDIDQRLSKRLRAIAARGQLLGNRPQAFSKVGDCNTDTPFFLAPFDPPQHYALGPYTDLAPLIANFQGSFGRQSLAAHTGFGPSAMFDPTWADPQLCERDEGPLPCELRLNRPSLVLISLGTHYVPQSQFESQYRRVIEYALEQGVIPILSTKVDSEGGDRVNAVIAWLAEQYQVPLWNFWQAAQPLYNHGQPDGIHFTWAPIDFGSAYSLRNGWPVRNLTALQALNAVWHASGLSP
jgi:hypothetical protein